MTIIKRDLLVSLIEMIISETGPIGFVMNFVSSAVFSLTASLIYRKTSQNKVPAKIQALT